MIEFQLKNRTISTDKDAFVAGIVNADNDSFWKKSRGGFSLAKRLIEEGADILDIGAESTRPGALYKTAAQEIHALIPLIKKIRKISDIPISIDTRKKEVMQACYEAGADILNDVSAMEDDPAMTDFCAQSDIPVILMHKRENSVTMDECTQYDDVFVQVRDYLLQRAEYAVSKGIKKERIILDPGIGFAKDFDGNMTLIKRIGELCSCGYPVMMALSRKRVIGTLTGRQVADRLCGTLAADLYCVMNGARFVRVHDVKETVDTLEVLKGIRDART
ncbi:MAG: dihydropteroate synthase [Treponema sp.]|nr:dihydropteroate synthase [Treponema sp.]